MARNFQLETDYQPTGDQPEAIDALVQGLEDGLMHQTLLGVTGSSGRPSSWRTTRPWRRSCTGK